MRIKLRNVILGLKDQLPLKRAFRNFFITGNALGLFNKRSHYRMDGKAKQGFPTKESGRKAADAMQRKHGKYFSVYKCIFCDDYHLGKNRDNK
jgi:hypothetical protein